MNHSSYIKTDRATRKSFDTRKYTMARLDGQHLYLYPIEQDKTVAQSTFWNSVTVDEIADEIIDVIGQNSAWTVSELAEEFENVSHLYLVKALYALGFKFYSQFGEWVLESEVIAFQEVEEEGLLDEAVEACEEDEEPTLTDDLLEVIQAAQDSEYKSKYKEALKVVNILTQKLAVKQQTSVYKPRPLPSVKSSSGSATAVLMLSDLHFGQVISPEQTNGKGGFNSEIALRRISATVDATIAYIEERRVNRNIDELVILLGGDIVEGELGHGTLTDMEVTEQVLFAEEALDTAINTIINSANVDARVVCVSGNHDRLPNFRRVPCDNRMLRSWDYLIYNQLAKHNKQIPFTIAQGYIAEFDVYKYKCLLAHGDDGISYGGGIGGISPSLLKWDNRQKQTFNHHYSYLGHWHQPTLVENRIIVNGGLPGTANYTHNKGLFGSPSQTLSFIDSEYGLNSFHVINLK